MLVEHRQGVNQILTLDKAVRLAGKRDLPVLFENCQGENQI
jgi:hypothetical protein